MIRSRAVLGLALALVLLLPGRAEARITKRHCGWALAIVAGVGMLAGIEGRYRPVRDAMRTQRLASSKAAVERRSDNKQFEEGLKRYKELRGNTQLRRAYFQTVIERMAREGEPTEVWEKELREDRLAELFAEISFVDAEAVPVGLAPLLDELYSLERQLYWPLFPSREVANRAFDSFLSE